MDRLKYLSSEKFFEGIVVDVNDCSVTMDLKGRMGQLKVPRRLVITDYELLVGQEVGLMMSYPEILGPEVDEDYAEMARREKEVKRKLEKDK
ncbi:CBO2463/CBO2479 domain-containing protein [Clostridium sp. DL1XJH146]